MNICFCINDSYVDILKICMFSILENNEDVNINFYIFSSFLSNESKNKLNQIQEKFNNCKIVYQVINNDIFTNFKLNIDYISIETYYRYIIADILTNIDKILYLDADTIINGNLKDLYDTDIENYYCAGVKDLYIEKINHKYNIGLNNSNTYINAGVLLLNLKKLREDTISKLLFEKTKELEEIIKYQDQDIINIVFKNKIKYLDSIYNYAGTNMHKEWKKHKHAIIIHYTGPQKPWLPKCHNKLRKIWKKYDKYFSKVILNKNDSHEFIILIFCIFLFIIWIINFILMIKPLYE